MRGCVIVETIRLTDSRNRCLVYVEDVLLLQKWEQLHGPCMAVLTTTRTDVRKLVVGIVMHVHRETNLLQVILALHAASCFTGLLHGRKKQSNQNANNRDHHEQFHQSEPWGFNLVGRFQRDISKSPKRKE